MQMSAVVLLVATLSQASTPPIAPANQPPDATAPTTWALEPDQFRGIAWGDFKGVPAGNLIAALRAKFGPVDRCFPMAEKGRSSCSAPLQVGKVNVKVVLGFGPLGFEAAILSFPAADYEFMRDVMLEKYGQPTSTDRKVLTNRMGAQFQNEELTWIGERITGSVARYSRTLDRGEFALVDISAAKAMADEQAAAKKKAAASF